MRSFLLIIFINFSSSEKLSQNIILETNKVLTDSGRARHGVKIMAGNEQNEMEDTGFNELIFGLKDILMGNKNR